MSGPIARRSDVVRLFDSITGETPASVRTQARELSGKYLQTGATLPLAAGDLAGPYEIVDVLGAGGQAVVYKARHQQIGRLVALKVPRREVGDHLLREGKLAAHLEHPSIARVEDVNLEGPAQYLVLELCEGGSLEDVLDDQSASAGLPLDRVREISKCILEALAFAHARGVIHRDIKPANVLFDRDGKAKVSDFGIGTLATADALSVSIDASQLTHVAGTPLYLAPEQENAELRQNGKLDGRADLFSFGKVLFQMLTGASPRTVRPPSRLRAGLDTAWDDYVFRLTEERPERRFKDASEALAALPPAALILTKTAVVAKLEQNAQKVAGLIVRPVQRAGAWIEGEAPPPLPPEPAPPPSEALVRARRFAQVVSRLPAFVYGLAAWFVFAYGILHGGLLDLSQDGFQPGLYAAALALSCYTSIRLGNRAAVSLRPSAFFVLLGSSGAGFFFAGLALGTLAGDALITDGMPQVIAYSKALGVLLLGACPLVFAGGLMLRVATTQLAVPPEQDRAGEVGAGVVALLISIAGFGLAWWLEQETVRDSQWIVRETLLVTISVLLSILGLMQLRGSSSSRRSTAAKAAVALGIVGLVLTSYWWRSHPGELVPGSHLGALSLAELSLGVCSFILIIGGVIELGRSFKTRRLENRPAPDLELEIRTALEAHKLEEEAIALLEKNDATLTLEVARLLIDAAKKHESVGRLDDAKRLRDTARYLPDRSFEDSVLLLRLRKSPR